MKLARSWAIGGATLAAAAVAWWVGTPAGGAAAPVWAPPQPAAAAVVAAPAPVQANAAPAVTAPAPAALPLVPVTLAGPDRLQVGEQAELTVAVGANGSVGEVAFTIRFDPNVLQVRAGSPGAWATGDGGDTRFTVEMTEAADVVQLRSAPANRPWSAAGGTVALVQFEAVGPGSTVVAMADVTVTDRSGRAMPVLLSTAKLPVTAEAAPQPP